MITVTWQPGLTAGQMQSAMIDIGWRYMNMGFSATRHTNKSFFQDVGAIDGQII
jgi:hypothetical protein